MATTESKKRSVNLSWLAVAVLAVVFVASAFAQDEPVVEEPLPDEELLMAPEEPQMPGTIEGTGTYFEVTDSEYLNIALASSEPVNLRLESVPQTVVMDIEAAEGATSTQITLTGFAPSTTYYKYEDDYHNEVAFTTDAGGSYAFAQDLAIPHLVFIQPQAGTIFIPSDTSIGDWDPVTRTYTLKTDVYETIQIDEDYLTLDGAGHTVTGPGSGNGVYFRGRTGVTIKNLNVQGFARGIHLRYSSDYTLTDNTASNNDYGISLSCSGGSTLTGNSMSGNRYNFHVEGWADAHFANSIDTSNTVDGKPVYYVVNGVGGIYDSSTNAGVFYAINCNGITIKDLLLTNNYEGVYLWNTHNSSIENVDASNNRFGIYLRQSNGNTLTGNTGSNNSYGIWLYYYCRSNTLTGNTTDFNGNYGIYLGSSSNNNILTANTASNNEYGIYFFNSSYNTLTGNTANSNTSAGINLYYSSNNNTLTDNTASNNAAGIVLHYTSNNNTLTGNTASNNDNGMALSYLCNNNTVTGNTVNSNNTSGIVLYVSSNNTVTGNTASYNSSNGIYLWWFSSGNTLTGNAVKSNNFCGIYLDYSSDNQVYNNNFIGNPTQAYVDGGSENVFNLLAPPDGPGGNYWSDYTGEDTDGDGIGDTKIPYTFTGGQDYLPWVVQNGWAPIWIEQLVYQVEALNLQKGIDNSLDAKLDAAAKALDDVNENNDVAAINTLQAFINAVEAQRGNKIPEADADALIAAAQAIIAMLNGV
jgi:parallel beta-helix repeat protein